MLFSLRTAHAVALLRSTTLTATPRPALVHFARAMSQSSQSSASQASTAVAGDRLVLSERRGAVLVLTLNRPKALNALSSPLFAELNAEFDKAQREEGVRAVVLTGGEKNFAGESYELRCDGVGALASNRGWWGGSIMRRRSLWEPFVLSGTYRCGRVSVIA